MGVGAFGQCSERHSGEGRLRGTVRTGEREIWVELEPLVRSIIGELVAPLGVQYDLNYFRGVPPVVNDEVAIATLSTAVSAVGPECRADTRSLPVARTFLVPRTRARRDGPSRGVGRTRPAGRPAQPQLPASTSARSTSVRALAGVVLGCEPSSPEPGPTLRDSRSRRFWT